MPISTDKDCELLTARLQAQETFIYGGFKLFVQMFSALVGGSVAVRLQYKGQVPTAFVHLSNWLAFLIVGASVIIILDAYRSWYGYRKTLSSVAGTKSGKAIIKKPDLSTASTTPCIMVLVMVAAFLGYVLFNPLSIPN